MAFFRRKRSSEAAMDALRRAREQHPSAHDGGKPAGNIRGLAPRRPNLNATDWAQINELLADGMDMTGVPVVPEERLHALMHALDQLRSFVRDERVAGATYVRNSLLDVWSIAQEIDPRLARPAEALLTGLVNRDLVGADEIHELCDRTERAATGRRIRHLAG